MEQKDLDELLKTSTPQEIINKYIRREVKLTESQIKKLIKIRGKK